MIKWFLLVCLTVTSNKIFANNTITISTSDWPPYVSVNDPHGGYISQVIREAFAEVNIAVKFEFVPWIRAYEAAKHGQFDATSYWYNDKKHENDFYMSDVISNEKTVFFRLKSNTPNTWRSFSDFSNLRLGLTRGLTYSKELWEYAERNKDYVSVVLTDEQNFKMLMSERIDLFPAQEVVGWHYIQSLFSKEQVRQVEIMHPPLFTHTGHLLFPKAKKNSAQLVKKFNSGLSKLKAKGRFKELNDKLSEGYFTKK